MANTKKSTLTRFHTQEGAMTRPDGEYSKTSRAMTAREIAEFKKKKKKK